MTKKLEIGLVFFRDQYSLLVDGGGQVDVRNRDVHRSRGRRGRGGDGVDLQELPRILEFPTSPAGWVVWKA